MPVQSALPHRTNIGFTLIELLVVIFIMGLIGGYAVLSIGTGGREMSVKYQAERLKGLLALAQQEAVIQGQPIGLQFESSGYRFLVAGSAHWQEITDVSALRTRKLPAAWYFTVLQEGHQLPIASFTLVDEEKISAPQIIFNPSGERESFDISLISPEESAYYRIVSTPEGPLQLLEVEER